MRPAVRNDYSQHGLTAWVVTVIATGNHARHSVTVWADSKKSAEDFALTAHPLAVGIDVTF